MNSVFREDARNEFLHRIRKHDQARDVVKTLAKEPFQIYTSTAPIDASHKWRLVSVASETLAPELAPLRVAISAWMSRWHLDAPWVGEVAVQTLREWEVNPSFSERLEWSAPWPSWMVPDEPRGPAPWTPHGDESSQDARRRITAWHKAQMTEIARQEKQARTQGLPTEPGRHRPQTIEWAIRFQVLEVPVSKIDAEKDLKTIRDAIYGFLDFIELPRRSSRGRPHGSQDHAGLSR